MKNSIISVYKLREWVSEKWLSYLRPHYSQNLNANFLLFNQLPFLLYHNCFISTDTPNDKHMANLFSVMKWYPFVTVTSVLTLTVVYLHLCETLSTDHFFQEPWITRFILFWMLTILFPFLFFSFCLNTLTTVKEYTGFTIKTLSNTPNLKGLFMAAVLKLRVGVLLSV